MENVVDVEETGRMRRTERKTKVVSQRRDVVSSAVDTNFLFVLFLS